MGGIDNCKYGVGSGTIAMTIPYNFSFGEFCAIFWSLVPYAVLVLFIIGFLFTRRISFLILIALGSIGSGINEYLLKDISAQDRPSKSCLESNGQAFPSGHSLNSMAYFTWCTIETLSRRDWSIKRRLFLCLVWAVVFIPVGPSRTVIHDHTWQQVWVGMVCGVAWAIIVWIITRFILARFVLEPLWSIKLIRRFFDNDYDRDYKRSHWKGEMIGKRTQNDKPHEKKLRTYNKKRVLLANLAIFFPLLFLGILGIILSFVKEDRDPKCDIASPDTMLVTGCLTVAASLIVLAVIFMTYRKLSGKNWKRFWMRGLLYFACFVLAEALYWNIGGIVASDDSDNCPGSGETDVGSVWVVLWFAVAGTLILITFILFYIMHGRKLYGSNLYEKNDQPKVEEMASKTPATA